MKEKGMILGMNGIDDPLVGDQKEKRMMIEVGRMVIKRDED